MKHIALISKNAERPAEAASLLSKAAMIANIQEALKVVAQALALVEKD